MSVTERVRLALTSTKAEHWVSFERLSSVYLTEEYPSLRTMATTSGDGGLDATIYVPEDEPTVAIQYSVTPEWETKVRKTAKRLDSTHPESKTLIYVTPHVIGAKVDAVRKSVMKDFGLYLDVRDQHYFVDRVERSKATREAAEAYCRVVVDPILADAGVLTTSGVHLNTHEARAALLYLVLQHEDANVDRQLTKLCYDALVRAVMRETDNDHRMARSLIQESVRQLTPTHEAKVINDYVDRALGRMTKEVVRHWTKEDEFCLTFEERSRLGEGLAKLALLNTQFGEEMDASLQFVADALGADLSIVDRDQLHVRLRRVIERFLFERGEAFVESLHTGQAMLFVTEEIEQVVNDDCLQHADTSSLRLALPRIMAETIERTLRYPSDGVQHYLRAIGDGYTLMAFLREAPNVQSAVSKLFSQGEIWLDTTAVLPMMAEQLLDEDERGYTRIIDAARKAGASIVISHGVVDEVLAHLALAMKAWRNQANWTGRTPFVFSAYIWGGGKNENFPKWIEHFHGKARPFDDLVEYFTEVHGIQVRDLAKDAASMPDELRWQTDAYWRKVHEGRRIADPEVIKQLAAHDTECFLGVLARRGGEQVNNPFGYSTWWLSFDGYAARAHTEIKDLTGMAHLDSPVLSIDFLTYYLVVGPARRQLERAKERQLPLLAEQSLLDALPKDLLAVAERVRLTHEGQDDRFIRRQIRDLLDQEKLKAGPKAKSGIDAIRDDIRMALEQKAWKDS